MCTRQSLRMIMTYKTIGPSRDCRQEDGSGRLPPSSHPVEWNTGGKKGRQNRNTVPGFWLVVVVANFLFVCFQSRYISIARRILFFQPFPLHQRCVSRCRRDKETSSINIFCNYRKNTVEEGAKEVTSEDHHRLGRQTPSELIYIGVLVENTPFCLVYRTRLPPPV